jgi:uncharacterized membrane protein YkvA (DUF1232 family)
MKIAAVVVAAYALSLIDIIPVLGCMDEVIIVPVAIFLVIKLIPRPLMVEFREEAQRRAERPTSRTDAVMIIGLEVAAAAPFLWVFWPSPAS